MTLTVIRAPPCSVRERVHLQTVHSSGLWHFFELEQDREGLLKYWCKITVGRESHLFGLWAESLQWPIHVSINCDRLSGVGQLLENRGKRLQQSSFQGWLLPCAWFRGPWAAVHIFSWGEIKILACITAQSSASLWLPGQHIELLCGALLQLHLSVGF